MSANVIDCTIEGDFALYNADCCEALQQFPDSSVDLCLHSPPFSSLYIYSDSMADMGNSASDEEFFEHYKFAIRELYRLMVPGRLVLVHCKDLPKYANKHGITGLIDFPGECIRAYEECGFSYHNRVTIWKCPVTERERTNNNGLLHKTILRDRSQVRMGMPDYLLAFRKPPSDGTLMGDKPITVDRSGVEGLAEYIGSCDPRATFNTNQFHPSPYARKSNDKTMESIRLWQRYAEPVWWDLGKNDEAFAALSPVWFDVDQTDVLNYKVGTETEDQKHICPLQLDLIKRAIQIYSQPGEVVLSPFAGVGSEGVGALTLRRRFIGIELKPSYYKTALTNLRAAADDARQGRLF